MRVIEFYPTPDELADITEIARVREARFGRDYRASFKRNQLNPKAVEISAWSEYAFGWHIGQKPSVEQGPDGGIDFYTKAGPVDVKGVDVWWKQVFVRADRAKKSDFYVFADVALGMRTVLNGWRTRDEIGRAPVRKDIQTPGHVIPRVTFHPMEDLWLLMVSAGEKVRRQRPVRVEEQRSNVYEWWATKFNVKPMVPYDGSDPRHPKGGTR